jgi:hypothetical protein
MSILWDIYPSSALHSMNTISDYDSVKKKEEDKEDNKEKDKKKKILYINYHKYHKPKSEEYIGDLKINYYQNGSKKVALHYQDFKIKKNIFDEIIKLLNNNNDKEYIKIILNRLTSIKFEKQNPMKQLSGTFNPQKIDDIVEWYCIGEYYEDKSLLKKKFNKN